MTSQKRLQILSKYSLEDLTNPAMQEQIQTELEEADVEDAYQVYKNQEVQELNAR